MKYKITRKPTFILMLFVMFFEACQEEQKLQPEIAPVEQEDIFSPVLNEPGSPIVSQAGDFSIAVLPDTQYYVSYKKGGKPEMFEAQVEWVKNNQEKENIVYVIHLGDLVQSGDQHFQEWAHAKNIMYGLENPVSIPYGIAVGNHDSRYGSSWTTNYYNKYFGTAHFEDRTYYGGHYGSNNDNHYDLFSAGGMDFIVIYIEYDKENRNKGKVLNWVHTLLNITYSSRKAIIVSHYILGNNSVVGTNAGSPGTFSAQGQRIYDRLKYFPNVFMMLSGHIGANGEGYRTDTYQRSTIRTFLSDYQSRENGGHGLMRLYTFSVRKNTIDVQTFSPYTNTHETDGDSQFTTALFE